MKAVAESYQNEIVAYTIEGKTLTASEYKQEILKAEKEIERGELITHESLKEEVRSWKK